MIRLRRDRPTLKILDFQNRVRTTASSSPVETLQDEADSRTGHQTRESTTLWCFFFFSGLVARTLIEPTRALQIMQPIDLNYLFCTSSLARIWVRIPNEVVGELVLQRRVQAYSPLGEIPVSKALQDGANSRTKSRVARCPWDLLFCR